MVASQLLLDCMEINYHGGWIYIVCPNFMKETWSLQEQTVNRKPVGATNTGISTDYVQKSPRSLFCKPNVR